MAEEFKAEAHQLPAGTVLHERFEIKRVIGEGGFGITYEGIDRRLNARVAVKEYYMSGFVNRNCAVSLDVIPSVGEKEETFRKNREKFYSEAMVLARFNGEDGIVRVQDYFQENQTAYIVMEYLDGGSLKDLLNRRGKLPWRETLELLLPGMISLGHVHEAGIIHRDISPDNIMLTKGGSIRILDFGAARKATEGDPKSLSVILKPGYAPEEQYRSKGVQGPWTDVYAFCATMYRCITGTVPEEAMDRLVSDTLRPVHFLVPDCPVSVSKVIGKGMAVSQADRYQNLDELISDLEWAMRNPGAQELPEGRHEDEPPVPAEVKGEPFAALDRIMNEELPGETLLPDLQALFDEAIPDGVSLPGLTTERRSTDLSRYGAERRSAEYGRTGDRYRSIDYGRMNGEDYRPASSRERSIVLDETAAGSAGADDAAVRDRESSDAAGGPENRKSAYIRAGSQEYRSILPGSPGAAAIDPNATVYAGRVETYVSPKENGGAAPVPPAAEKSLAERLIPVAVPQEEDESLPLRSSSGASASEQPDAGHSAQAGQAAQNSAAAPGTTAQSTAGEQPAQSTAGESPAQNAEAGEKKPEEKKTGFFSSFWNLFS